MQETSHQARRSLKGSPSLRDRVCEVVARPSGATDEEIETSLDLRHQTASARRRELVQQGRIEDSGLRRANKSGRSAIVWRVVVKKRPPTRVDELKHDVGLAAVVAAAAEHVLQGAEQRLHWMVDLRGLSYDPTAPECATPEWLDMMTRFRAALDAQEDMTTECMVALTAVHCTRSTGRELMTTYSLRTRVDLVRFMKLPPPMGHWLLWPFQRGANCIDADTDEMPDLFWYDSIPF